MTSFERDLAIYSSRGVPSDCIRLKHLSYLAFVPTRELPRPRVCLRARLGRADLILKTEAIEWVRAFKPELLN